MLVAEVPEKQKLAKLEADMKTMASLLRVVQSLELVIEMYASARGLVWRSQITKTHQLGVSHQRGPSLITCGNRQG